MGIEVIEQDGAFESIQSDIGEFIEENEAKNPKVKVDARRKLEDKLEELRLSREMKEFDFDA